MDSTPPKIEKLPAERWLGLLVALGIVLAFGAALDGELLWDDPSVLSVALSDGSPWLRDLFGLGEHAAQGAGPSYWRPLTLLTMRFEVALAPLSPAPVLHASNLLWHILASILLARWLLRCLPAKATTQQVACWLGVLIWAVLPLKVENVAWISGRGDAMGLALLLGGLELMQRMERPALRMLAAALATALALLSKESMVVSVVFVALAVRNDGRSLRPALTSRETIASGVVVALYLGLRTLVLPIAGGGTAMFAGLSMGQRLLLSLETIGHGLRALLLPFDAHVLRGPIGFSAPFVLQRDWSMAALGAAGLVAGALVAYRMPKLRPLLLLLAVTMAPVANLVPTGLESRMSDRFLYLPSIALAMALTLALAWLAERKPEHARLGMLVAGLVAVSFTGLSLQRSFLFRSSDALWSWEAEHGERATTVLVNAGNAAIVGGRWAEARDYRAAAAERYRELGFDEGFRHGLEAAALQVKLTGDSHAPSRKAYGDVLVALIEGWDKVIEVPFPDGGGLELATGTADARAYGARNGPLLSMRLLVLAARRGASDAAKAADGLIDAHEGARSLLVDAARVHLALGNAARARVLLESLPDRGIAAELRASADLQQRVNESTPEGPLRELRAAFVGEAYRPACKAGAKVEDRSEVDTRIAALSCLLSGRDAVTHPDVAAMKRELVEWRLDARRRGELTAQALSGPR